MAQAATQAVEIDTVRSGNGRLLLHRHDQKNRSRRTPTLGWSVQSLADILQRPDGQQGGFVEIVDFASWHLHTYMIVC